MARDAEGVLDLREGAGQGKRERAGAFSQHTVIMTRYNTDNLDRLPPAQVVHDFCVCILMIVKPSQVRCLPPLPSRYAGVMMLERSPKKWMKSSSTSAPTTPAPVLSICRPPGRARRTERPTDR